jgi:uncharacterized protein (TIGR02217 family)
MVTSQFHDTRLPEYIEAGSKGGPEFNTTVIMMTSGREQRNKRWALPRATWDIMYGIRDQEDYQLVLSFFYARSGRAFGFRFKDWSDYTAVGQVLGTGTAVSKAAVGTLTYAPGGSATASLTFIPSVAATAVLEIDSNPANSKTVVIDGSIYTFTTGNADAAYKVKIGVSAAITIDNLINAINATATPGLTTYGVGTIAHPTVSASAGAGSTIVATAIIAGVSGNAITTTTNIGGAGSWNHSTLTGGVDEPADGTTVTIDGQAYEFVVGNTTAAYEVHVIGGDIPSTRQNLIDAINGTGTPGLLTYGTGTVVHPTVAGSVGPGNTMVATAKTAGVAGNSIAVSKTIDGSWDHSPLSGGSAGPIVDTNTVTLNGQVYTFVAGSASVPYAVHIAGTTVATIQNLIDAVNATGTPGVTTYGVGTVVHPTISASTTTTTNFIATARTAGVAGNALTLASLVGTWDHATLTGGANAGDAGSGLNPFQLTKVYADAILPFVRKITRPVTGTVVLYDNATPIDPATYAVDYTTGIVAFNTGHVPLATHIITADFEYDIPARFDADKITLVLDWVDAGAVDSIIVRELREGEDV